MLLSSIQCVAWIRTLFLFTTGYMPFVCRNHGLQCECHPLKACDLFPTFGDCKWGYSKHSWGDMYLNPWFHLGGGWGIDLGGKLWVTYYNAIVSFWKNYHNVSHSDEPFDIPPAVYRNCKLLHTLIHMRYFHAFNDYWRPPRECEVVSHLRCHPGFDLPFLMTSDNEHLFMSLFGHLFILFGEMSSKSYVHF